MLRIMMSSRYVRTLPLHVCILHVAETMIRAQKHRILICVVVPCAQSIGAGSSSHVQRHSQSGQLQKAEAI